MEKRYSHPSVVSRSIIGHQASSARTERCFGTAGRPLRPERNRLDTTFVDMVVFLRAYTDHIPPKISEISPVVEKKLLSRMPQRFEGNSEKKLLGFNATAQDGDEEIDTNAGFWDEVS